MLLSPNSVTSRNGIEKHLIAHFYVLTGSGWDHTTIEQLYKDAVETSPKSIWHSHDFSGRLETNEDVTSHNVTLRSYLAG